VALIAFGDPTSRSSIAVRRRAHDDLGAILLPAPGLFSTTNCCPSALRQPLTDQTRENVVRTAGGKPTMIRSGRDG
jgi:hypothetical protein